MRYHRGMNASTLRIRLFAGLKDRLGPEIDLAVPAPARAGDLKAALAAAHPELATMVQAARVAVDRGFVGPEHPLAPGQEIALLPPVSGG